jgi:hypothetical protein
MRVSLWQQFSSNHSGSFTVVGTFESAEKANAAADKLREIIQTIQDWYKQRPELADQAIIDPIPPEVEFARQYDVEWDRPVDWYNEESPVSVLDDSVMVLHVPDTWSYPLPFLGILKQFGGSVVYEFEFGAPLAEFSIKLTCTAPDEAAASDIAALVNIYLQDPHFSRPPWHQKGYDVYKLGVEGALQQTGKTLAFDLHFFTIEKGLPALINYLRAQGCTGIEYHFEQGLEVDF